MKNILVITVDNNGNLSHKISQKSEEVVLSTIENFFQVTNAGETKIFVWTNETFGYVYSEHLTKVQFGLQDIVKYVDSQTNFKIKKIIIDFLNDNSVLNNNSNLSQLEAWTKSWNEATNLQEKNLAAKWITSLGGIVPKQQENVLTETLIKFLDGHEFTEDELNDVEYISNSVSNFPDYFGGTEISDEDSLKLAELYIKHKKSLDIPIVTVYSDAQGTGNSEYYVSMGGFDFDGTILIDLGDNVELNPDPFDDDVKEEYWDEYHDEIQKLVSDEYFNVYLPSLKK